MNTKNTMNNILKIVLCALLCAFLAGPAFAGRAERKAGAIAESEKPRSLRGGTSFDVSMNYTDAFDAVVKHLKLQEYEVATADRDAGMIATAIEVTGGWRQTGTRVVVSLIKKEEAVTVVRVTVTEQKRHKALQVEPWSEPKVEEKKTAETAQKLKEAL
jgi:hypothetical protein